MVFFGRDNETLFHIDIPGGSASSLLEPNKINGMKQCYISHGIKDFQILKAKITFAIIYLEIQYKDILMNKSKTEHFYACWVSKFNEFGGPKDWQIGLAQKWAKEYYK